MQGHDGIRLKSGDVMSGHAGVIVILRYFPGLTISGARRIWPPLEFGTCAGQAKLYHRIVEVHPPLTGTICT
jgi:hypothetical protein